MSNLNSGPGTPIERDRFPSLQRFIQLSSCSQSALHVEVRQAVEEYLNTWEARGMDWDGWMAACEQARARFARLIGADPDEVAIVSSVSHALSALATSLPLTRRNRVVTTQMDFPCIGHVWLSQPGLDVVFLPAHQGEIPLAAYEEAVDERTLLVSTFHVAYENGFKQDLARIAEIAHARGAYLLVDAYQSAGQTPIDVRRMGIDMLVTGMQKYLLGVPGLAFLYVRRDLADRLTPRVTGWFGQANPFAFNGMEVDYAPAARRFDGGTAPMINGFAARAALDVILRIGVDRIEAHLRHLSQVALDHAGRRGLQVRSPGDPERKGSTTAIVVPDAHRVEQLLREEGFVVSARRDVIRIAPHFYNSEDDVRAAIDCLAHILSRP